MKEIYEVPSNAKEIFDNPGVTYKIVNYKMEMDNIQALTHFIETAGIKSEDIVDNMGTSIIIKHDDYENFVHIDSSGLGDFFSHQFETKLVKKVGEDYLDVIE